MSKGHVGLDDIDAFLSGNNNDSAAASAVPSSTTTTRPPLDRMSTSDSINNEDEHTQTFVDAELGEDVDAFLASEGAANDDAAGSSDHLHLPPVPQLHVLAKLGDLAKIVELLSSGESDANEKDSEGITALHWAAMMMRTDVCKELLSRGAEVDAVGGELQATPLHWAARNGNLYVVHLLIQHGADPGLSDGQGFNTLHLAVHSHNPMLLAYLLSQQLPLSVDSEDSAGQTSLQWACFQGDQISVSLLLKAGADPNKADASGLTAVHWAAVKGSVGCIAKVVDAGGDCLKKNNSEMNPVDLARRQHSIAAWERAMESIGRLVDGRRRKKTLSEGQTKVAIFFLPLVTSYLILSTLSTLPWHTGLALSAAESYGMHHVITKVLLDAKPALGGTKGSDALQKSPYLVALLASSIFWVGYVWSTKIVITTSQHAYTNFVFASACLLCAYNLFRAVSLDPGFVAKPASETEIREVVDGLTSTGKMNGQNFCLVCMSRQPLRSRHCRHCNRCVARFDHHCPWIWNCVGVNNHRQFICFVVTLIIGIVSFDYLSYQYFAAETPEVSAAAISNCLMPGPICAASHFDTRTFAVMLWATVQISWTTIVLASQLYQMSRGITTFEVSNLGRYGHLGSRGLSASAQEGYMADHAHSHGGGAAAEDAGTSPTTPASGQASASTESGHVHGPQCRHGHSHAHAHSHNPLKLCSALVSKCVPNALLAIVGLDLYTRGRGAEGMAKAAEKGGGNNPFDVGLVRNCTDFWTRGKTLGVDYQTLWEVPPEGFRAILIQRKRALADQAQTHASSRKRGGASSGGYEMLRTSLEEV